MRQFIYQLPLLLMLAVAQPAAGSTLPPRRPLLTADTTAPLDTARVLGQLFAHKRKVYHTMLVPSALAVVAFNYSLAYSKSETAFQQLSRGLNAGFVAFFAYRLGQSIVQLRRYRVGREQALLAALAHGQPLPRPVRQQLVGFLQPAPTKQ